MKQKVIAKCFDYDPPKMLEFNVESPNTCPRCNLAWQPYFAFAVYSEIDEDDDYDYFLDVLWFCPSCKGTSISCYLSDGEPDAYLKYSFPKTMPEAEFYKGIKELSPSFVKIYQESLNAECHNLFEVAGMGYRKALEFLVKDYAIKVAPSDKESIEELPLAQCISTYISNKKISEILKRTVWLGNDQTHYKKKHDELGIEDLKILLNLSISYITMELQAEEAMKITKK